MSDIGRNRTVLGSIAAIVIVVGLLLMSGMPGGSAPASPSPGPATPAVADTNTSQPDQFAIRDYSEFEQGGGVDLPSSDWLGLLAGMALKLAFVIALIYLVIRVLKHYVYKRRPQQVARRPVSVLSSVNLAPNRTVYVLDVAGKLLVVGATPGQMSLLTEVTDPAAIEEVRLLSAESPPADQFGSIMSAFGRRWGSQDATASASPLGLALQDKLVEGRGYVQSKISEVKKSLGRD